MRSHAKIVHKSTSKGDGATDERCGGIGYFRVCILACIKEHNQLQYIRDDWHHAPLLWEHRDRTHRK